MRAVVRDIVELAPKQLRVLEPILDVGSKQVRKTGGDLRPYFPDAAYIGLDAQPGRGVDLVADIEDMSAYPDATYGTILCIDTLEHVRRPWLAAREMGRLLKDGGWLLATTVMNFHIHKYPADYWRYTPQGLQALFEDTEHFREVLVLFGKPRQNPSLVVALCMKGDGQGPVMEFMEEAWGLVSGTVSTD